MTRRLSLLVLVLVLALLPGVASAQLVPEDGEPYDTLIRFNAPYHNRPGETAQGIVVVGDNARVEGTVHTLVVLNGDAVISGTVEHSVYLFRGTLTLTDSARIARDVALVWGTLDQADGAVVEGTIDQSWLPFSNPVYWFQIWLSMTLLLAIAGVCFAAAGGRQLNDAVGTLASRAGPTLIGMLILWIGLPGLMMLVDRLPYSFPLSQFVQWGLLPLVWCAGYLVAATALGNLVLRLARIDRGQHPFKSVLLGVLALQVLNLPTLLGGFWLLWVIPSLIAGLLGSGALLVRAWTGWRGDAPPDTPPASQSVYAPGV